MTKREFLKKSGRAGLVAALLLNGIGLKEVFADNNSVREYVSEVKYFYPHLRNLMTNYGFNFEGTDNPNNFSGDGAALAMYKTNERKKIVSVDCKIYTGGDMPKNLKADAIRNEIVHETLETDEAQKQLDKGEKINYRHSHRDTIKKHLEQYGEWLTPNEYLRWAISYVRNGDGKEFPVSPIYTDERGRVKASDIRWTEQIPEKLNLDFIINGQRKTFLEVPFMKIAGNKSP
ncbi:MAG: hypothetical protein KKF67_03355 [Nanoarchaeota archaeon]|nr:hypothetical protein [Nanoarchaeota archaeon]